METKNRLVNQETKENYSDSDKYGFWEYQIEEGVLRGYTTSIQGVDIFPSDDCKSLEEFEEEISELFDCEVAFSGLTKEEREEQNKWIKLRYLLENGHVMHVNDTSEEWLTDFDENYIFLGRGEISDWNTEKAKEEGVKYKKDQPYPDSVGGYSSSDIYFQVHKDVSNPYDIDDFEMVNGFISKR